MLLAPPKPKFANYYFFTWIGEGMMQSILFWTLIDRQLMGRMDGKDC